MAETLGEDPYLTGVLGAAMIRGIQGDVLGGPGSLAACAKHYVGYGAAEAGRDYNTTNIPEILLREVYLRPFRAARDADVATFMTAFNALNGVPATGNEFTVHQVLRGEWKYDGLVVSDYESVRELVVHGYAADSSDAAFKAVRAGVDMEMVSTTYFDHLKSLVEQGRIATKTIDESVRNILRLKFRVGLFDNSAQSAKPAEIAPDGLDIARRLAAQSMVLLKNEGNVLPIARSIGKLAVIGPLADSPVDQMGTWVMDARPDDVRTPPAALRNALGEERVSYAKALRNSRDINRDGFGEAREAARSADVVLLFLGEEQILSGEAHSRAFLDLPGAQTALVEETAALGKPTVAIIMAGRPLTFHEVAGKAQAVLYAWHPGTMGGPALADLLLGETAPSGKLTITFPRIVGQVPIYYNHVGIPMGNQVDRRGYTSKYLDVDYTPEYPFGYGLSYTTFEYSSLHVTPSRTRSGGTLTVSAEVANTGDREAEEVVQLYVRDLVGSVSRPVRELKGFERIRLKPKQTQKVTFSLSTGDPTWRSTTIACSL